MTTLYLLTAAAGTPLVIWFLVSGSDDGGDAGGDDAGFGGVMLRLLPLSTIAIAVAAFGLTGLVLGAVGTSAALTLICAIVVAAFAGVLNSTAFAYLRRTDSSASLSDNQLAGSTGRVVLAMGGDHRGRITVRAGGQQLYFTARALEEGIGPVEIEVGAPVLVIEVTDGVAIVTRLDPELA